jgi:CheY-like chemotaxis protein
VLRSCLNNPLQLTVMMTILNVDDDIEDQEIFTEAINFIDPLIRCIIANDGMEGHRLIFDGKTYLSLDYIFLDINMPKLNGIELLGLIKADTRFHKIPVYVLSTSCSPDDTNKIHLLGAKLFEKQSNFQTNVRMLTSIIRREEGSNVR